MRVGSEAHARSQVTLQDAVDLLAFTEPATGSSRKVSVGHQPGDLVPPASLITGKGSSSCSSIPGRGCSLSGSLIAMNRYSGFFLL